MNQITVHGKTYKLPKSPVWHKGPPPSIGWWPASISCDVEILRWWDGTRWSDFVTPEYSIIYAGEFGGRKSPNQRDIKWTTQWWK